MCADDNNLYQFEELDEMEEMEKLDKSDQLESELVIRLKVKVAEQLEGFVGAMQV